MTGVRFREDTFQGQCETCHEWWPISTEFWLPRWGVRRCRACVMAHRRDHQNARYWNEPAYRETRLEAARLTAWKDRVNKPTVISDRKHAYYLANRQRILAQSRERYASRKRVA